MLIQNILARNLSQINPLTTAKKSQFDLLAHCSTIARSTHPAGMTQVRMDAHGRAAWCAAWIASAW